MSKILTLLNFLDKFETNTNNLKMDLPTNYQLAREKGKTLKHILTVERFIYDSSLFLSFFS